MSSIFHAAGLRSKLVLDTRNYFVSKIVPGLMGLLTVMVFVRLVGYEQYGRYAILMAVVTACATAASGWLNQGILRFHSQHAGTHHEHTFTRGSRLGTLLSVAAGSIVVYAVVWHSSGRSGPAAVALALFVPMVLYTVELTRLQASLRSATVVGVESMRAIVGFLIPLGLVAVTRSKNYLLLLAGVGIGYLITLTTKRGDKAHPAAETGRSTIFGESERYALGRIWNYGWPVALWLACQSCLVVSDRYFIQRFRGYADAGVYASIYDVIVRSFSLVFAPVTLSVHSILMHRWNCGERRGTMGTLRKAMLCELLLFLPAPVALFFLNARVAHLILGAANVDAARALLPLALGGFLWQLALLAHKPLEMLCRTRRMLAGIIAALTLNVLGNCFLVPRFGFLAAAYLSAATAGLYLLLLTVLTPADEFAAASRATEREPGMRMEEEVTA
ncbi:MAG TPA: hypothetical protein VMG31_06160 [Verrucomicrobiae bacterium]|nr:hypothetical protein [Verrucomicrobiae bacterium]